MNSVLCPRNNWVVILGGVTNVLILFEVVWIFLKEKVSFVHVDYTRWGIKNWSGQIDLDVRTMLDNM